MDAQNGLRNGKTINKNVVYSNFSRPESSRRILSVIFDTASNIFLHFVASIPLTYKTIFFYALTVKKQCLIVKKAEWSLNEDGN